MSAQTDMAGMTPPPPKLVSEQAAQAIEKALGGGATGGISPAVIMGLVARMQEAEKAATESMKRMEHNLSVLNKKVDKLMAAQGIK